MRTCIKLLFTVTVLLVFGCSESVKPDPEPDSGTTSTDGTVDMATDSPDASADSNDNDLNDIDTTDVAPDNSDTTDSREDEPDATADGIEGDGSDAVDDIGEGDGRSDLNTDASDLDIDTEEIVEVCDPNNQFDSWDITEDRTLTRACSPYVIDQRADVSNGATLTIEPGVALHFDFNTWLRVGVGSGGAGHLIARGTEARPIVFTTQDDHHAAGEWYGLVFGPGAVTVGITHAEVHYGGRDAFGTEGCLTIDDAPSGALLLDTVTFEDCLQSGLAHLGGDLQELLGLRFVNSGEFGFRATPETLGDIQETYEYVGVDANFVKTGTVTKSATWLAQGIPFESGGRIDVEGDSGPMLTLGEGLELLFPDHAWLRVGAGAAGRLLIDGSEAFPVRLASSVADEAGGWFGVHFREHTIEGSSVDWAVIEHAGRSGFGVRGCLTIDGTADARVAVSDSVFRNCSLAGVGVVNHDFGFEAFDSNTFEECDAGLRLPPHAVASVGSGHIYGSEITHNLMDGGDVEEEVDWHPQGIPWRVGGTVNVAHADGADLSLLPGMHLQFASNTRFRIGATASGRLYASGTIDDPIIIEGQPAASAGSWNGIHFDANAMSESRIDHVVVRHGGKPGFNTAGCVTIRSPQGRVSVTNSVFESCEQACLGARGESPNLIENNSFSDCPLGMWLHADAVGSVFDDQTYDGVTRNLIDGGTVATSANWRAQSVPYDVDGDIVVEGDPTVTLDLVAGSELRFESSGWLSVGGGDGAILNINGTSDQPVVMTSSLVEPTAGAWHGIFLHDETESASISYLDLSFAGQGGFNVRAGITLKSTGSGVDILNSTLHDNAQADIAVDCGSSPTLTGNTLQSGGVVRELCR